MRMDLITAATIIILNNCPIAITSSLLLQHANRGSHK